MSRLDIKKHVLREVHLCFHSSSVFLPRKVEGRKGENLPWNSWPAWLRKIPLPCSTWVPCSQRRRCYYFNLLRGNSVDTKVYFFNKNFIFYLYVSKIRSFITAAHCGLKRNLTSQTITDKRLEHNQAVHIFAGMYNKLVKENSQQFSRVAVMKYHPGYRNFTPLESLSMQTWEIRKWDINCSPWKTLNLGSN